MPARKIATSVPANSTVDNALVGSVFEFTERPTEITVALASAAVGIEAEVFFGPELQLERSPVAVESALDVGPILPDNLVTEDLADGGRRIVVKLHNTTAGAIVSDTYIRFRQVA